MSTQVGEALDGWRVEEAFAVVALVSDTSDGSSNSRYEIAGIFQTESEARSADIKGWWGAPSAIQRVQVLTNGREVFLLYPHSIDYGVMRERISLGTEDDIFKS